MSAKGSSRYQERGKEYKKTSLNLSLAAYLQLMKIAGNRSLGVTVEELIEEKTANGNTEKK